MLATCGQVDLFADHFPANAIRSSNKYLVEADTVLDWRLALRGHQTRNRQSDLVSELNAEANIDTYHSGASAISDLKGYMKAGTQIGVCVLDTSANVRTLLAEYASTGNKIFVDSGAFRAFQQTLRTGEVHHVDFEKVFKLYGDIASQCSAPGNVIFVAPDVVGDQEQSITVLRQYVEAIEDLTNRGFQFMLPLQKGQLDLGEHYKQCLASFKQGFDPVIGLPSNAEALSHEEVLDFIATTKPRNVHFLGTSENTLAHRAKNISPETHFSCDASKIRKHIGRGRLLTETHKGIFEDGVIKAFNGERLGELGIGVEWDITDIIGDISNIILNFSETELKAFCREVHCSTKELCAAAENDDTWTLLDDRNHGYGYNVVHDFFWKLCCKEVSRKSRQQSVFMLAKDKII